MNGYKPRGKVVWLLFVVMSAASADAAIRGYVNSVKPARRKSQYVH